MLHLLNYGIDMLLMWNILKYLEVNDILKDNRNGKLDTKSDEGIFQGCSTKSKCYTCLNSNTNKVVESVNVKFDEFIERSEIRL